MLCRDRDTYICIYGTGDCSGTWVVNIVWMILLAQRWANYGPRDDFMRPARSYKKMNRSTEDAKTFSFAPHLYFRRTQDIQ